VSREGEIWFKDGFRLVRIEQKVTSPRWTGWGSSDEIVPYGPCPSPPVSFAEGMHRAETYVEGEPLNGRKIHCLAGIMKVSGFKVSSGISRSSPN
jgi:hypothetical protein